MSKKLFLILVLSSITIISIIAQLIRHKKLSEEYSLIWIITSIALVVITFFINDILYVYALYKGKSGSGPYILLFFSIMFIVFMLIFICAKLSTYQRNISELTRAIGLLENELRGYKNEIKQNAA